VPSSEGQVRAALAGWGATVVPELQVRSLLASGELVNLSPAVTLPVNLYWHCWNLNSVVIDRLTSALAQGAAQALPAKTKTA
jgi:LysR family transcriptional regulator (chromosome initiation inhibitor)